MRWQCTDTRYSYQTKKFLQKTGLVLLDIGFDFHGFITYKGSFNIRIGTDLHKQIALQSLKEGKSINDYVKEAVYEKVQRDMLQVREKSETYKK